MFKTAKDCRQQFQNLRSKRVNWESRYQAISDYQLARSDFQEQNKNQSPRDSKIYDGTAMDSWFMLTNAIQAILVNTETNWIYFDTVLDSELTDEEILWFDYASKTLLSIFRSDASRFPTQMNEALGDLTAFGYCAIHSHYDPGMHTLCFNTRPIPEIYIDQNEKGDINKVIRRFQLKNEDALRLYGEATPDIVKKAIAANKHSEERYWLQTFSNHPDKPKKFISYTLMEDDVSGFVTTDTYNEMPIHVARWRTDAGEVYGRGPGVVADPFARTLNEVVKTWIKQCQKAVDPPLLVSDDGVIQGPKTTPGSINFVSSYSPGSMEPIRPLNSGANFSVANAEIERLQNSIRKAYHHDILQITDSKELTAFHVQELTQRAQQWIAPVFQRIKVELIQPMVQRALRLAIQHNIIAAPPASLQQKGIKTVYISPAQRANQAQEAEATMRAVERIIALSQVYPDILDNYDADKLARQIHTDFAADPSILKSQKEVQMLRKNREQAKQQQMQAEQQGEMMKAAAPAMATPDGQAQAAEVLNQLRGSM